MPYELSLPYTLSTLNHSNTRNLSLHALTLLALNSLLKLYVIKPISNTYFVSAVGNLEEESSSKKGSSQKEQQQDRRIDIQPAEDEEGWSYNI